MTALDTTEATCTTAANPAAAAPSLSVIVPIYNEIELLEATLRRLSAFLHERSLEHEIVIVESASTDGSALACDRLAAELPFVSVIHEAKRNGMGAALRLGYRAATKSIVWLVTADVPFALETLDEALPLLNDVDCVLSYRSSDDRGLHRKVQSWGYNTIVRSVLGLPMRNVNSAFKLYRRELVAELDLISNGWLLDAEVLYWIARKGRTYREIPVPLLDREAGVSKVGPLDGLKTLIELLRFRQTLVRAQRRAAGDAA